jgi:hypothetical protein
LCPDICLDVIVGDGRKLARSMDDTVFDVLLRSWLLRREEEGLLGIGSADAENAPSQAEVRQLIISMKHRILGVAENVRQAMSGTICPSKAM